MSEYSGDYLSEHGGMVLGWVVIGLVAVVILISAFWKK